MGFFLSTQPEFKVSETPRPGSQYRLNPYEFSHNYNISRKRCKSQQIKQVMAKNLDFLVTSIIGIQAFKYCSEKNISFILNDLS